jgi:tRNA (Thr-GGU) A37 N-methylase
MVKMASERVAELVSVGVVEADEARGDYRLHIDEQYRPALQGLGSCTHAMVFWWADRPDPSDAGDLVVDLPYAPGVRSGVFANRSHARPNPICVTTAFILDVDEAAGIVTLAWIDAFDGTPILDIKPYLPMSDRVMSAEYPEWLKGFPASMEEAAEFFADPENAALFE